jgi:hypothetical protein
VASKKEETMTTTEMMIAVMDVVAYHDGEWPDDLPIPEGEDAKELLLVFADALLAARERAAESEDDASIAREALRDVARGIAENRSDLVERGLRDIPGQQLPPIQWLDAALARMC